MAERRRAVSSSAWRIVMPWVEMGSPTARVTAHGIEVAGVDGEQIVDTAEGDGDERNLGADGEESCSGEKGLEVAVGRAATFREDEEGHAGAEGADGTAEAGERRVGVDGVDGNLAGAIEIPADEGDGPQLFFGEDAELEGQGGEDDGRVHIGRVVGGVDGDGMLQEVFGTSDGEACAGDGEAAAGPGLGDAVLNSARFFDKRNEKREGAAVRQSRERRRGPGGYWCANGGGARGARADVSLGDLGSAEFGCTGEEEGADFADEVDRACDGYA